MVKVTLGPLDEVPEDVAEAAIESRIQYEQVRGSYEAFAISMGKVLEESLRASGVLILSVTPRTKTPESFERKALRMSDDDPTAPRYGRPFEEITDKAGVRVITYFLRTLDDVCRVIEDQFQVIERLRKSGHEPERVGYQSIHYLVKYPDRRTELLDFRRFEGMVAEIQVRTILQHAWAEIEHEIQYKATETVPARIKRRFEALAGLVEIGDREFQAIDDDNRQIQEEARRNVDLGNLSEVEVTADSIRTFLDKRYGPDGRMTDLSYRWAARLLRHLGFTNLSEVDECITGYDDAQVSRSIHGSRRGQVTRLQGVLLASMGDRFIAAHPSSEPDDYQSAHRWLEALTKLQEDDIPIGEYRPSGYPDRALRLFLGESS
jgi:ppGpp synthetase/RelA/SpoT-type nucleotidyltranferase